MKRVKLSTALVLVSLLVVSCATLRNYGYSDEQVAEFKRVTSQLNTPHKVDKWLSENFRYNYDTLVIFRSRRYTRAELWSRVVKYPVETFFEKEGVCIDAANFAAYCLKKAGYTVRTPMALVYKKGHTVCAVKMEDGWWMAGNTHGFHTRGPWKTYRELLFHINKWEPHEVHYKYRKGW